MSASLLAAIEETLGPHPPEKLGVAVSGGGDSIALLSLLAAFARTRSVELLVVTVDHNLRTGAVAETRLVTSLCQSLNLSHHVEYWTGWNGTGNLQALARDARYEMMADWACANEIRHIALGHTADDQAETVLMRLARIGGVDGLSGMSPRHVRHGVTWLRPLLGIRRHALRAYLRDQNIAWADDPSNDDERFERVRVRKALVVLEDLGIGTDTLVQTSQQMAEARKALDWQTFLAAQTTAQVHHGAVALDMRHFRTLPTEIRRRLRVHSLCWLSGRRYPPRRDAVMGALNALQDGKTFTLEGCQITPQGQVAWLHRELNAVRDSTAEVGDIWDDRWSVTGPDDDPDFEVRALGIDALAGLENWRSAGLPRAALAVTPAVWHAGQLVAAPVAQPDPEWSAQLEGGTDAYFAALLSH